MAARWDQLVGATEPESDRTKQLRAVRYTDESGATRGLALYRVTGGDADFSEHLVEVERLDAETPDAASHPLALPARARPHHRAEGPPAPRRRADALADLGDFRGAKSTSWEHQYLRVLDVPAVFEARSYAASGELVLMSPTRSASRRVSGTLVVEPVETTVPLVEPVEPKSLRASVTKLETAPAGVPLLHLTANELASLYLGGVAATTLLDAGRISEGQPGDALIADGILRSARAPWLSVWY